MLWDATDVRAVDLDVREVEFVAFHGTVHVDIRQAFQKRTRIGGVLRGGVRTAVFASQIVPTLVGRHGHVKVVVRSLVVLGRGQVGAPQRNRQKFTPVAAPAPAPLTLAPFKI